MIALDYGKVHTGAAISDPSGTIVRPLPELRDAATDRGLAAVAELVSRENAVMVVVGMPVSLSGERGAQAEETAGFISELTALLPVRVVAWDERFTSKIARERGRGSAAAEHSIAACCLLEDYLSSAEYINGG